MRFGGSTTVRGDPGRRAFLVAGGALALVPLSGKAQRTAALPAIGFISPVAPGPRNVAFAQALNALGYVDGRNLRLEMRFAGGAGRERFDALVRELIDLRVDVLVVGSTLGALAAKAATSTIPIVFASSSDPVAAGVVPNLSRPGGNVTGTSTAYGDGLAGKWLQLLKEVVPTLSHCAALITSTNAAAAKLFAAELQSAAQALRVKLDLPHATTPGALDDALAAIGGSGAQGLVVPPSPFASAQQDRIVRFAAAQRLPAVYFVEDFVDAGGLMSYGPSIVEGYRQAASYVDRILKGAKPGGLPVEQPTKVELVVNLRTAKALGVTIPHPVLLRADRVIR